MSLILYDAQYDQEVGIMVSSLLASHSGLRDKKIEEMGRDIIENIAGMIMVCIHLFVVVITLVLMIYYYYRYDYLEWERSGESGRDEDAE